MAKLPVQEPTFWPIDGLAWNARTAADRGMSISSDTGLSLAARADGPLALSWPDGSIGGLALPSGMAMDEDNRLYLLDLQSPWRIRTYKPAKEIFTALPGLGGRGSAPRLFNHPANIALLRSNLYIVDQGNRRVQVFDRYTLALRHLWDASYGTPRDIAAGPKSAWLLMEDGRVYRHRPGSDWPLAAFQLPGNPLQYKRILVDQEERLYFLHIAGAAAVLHIYDAAGQLLQIVDDAGDVRGRFKPPALRLFFNRRNAAKPDPRHGYFCLPGELTGLCAPRLPVQPPDPERPLEICLPVGGTVPRGAQIFDRRGRPIQLDSAELVESPIYRARGLWISKALDSDRYRCQWHRVALNMDQLTPGTRVIISTLSADAAAETPAEENGRWLEGFRLAGPLDKPGPKNEQPNDFLVQSRPGQYLWLKIIFESDGFSTPPALRKMQVHFSRQSYLGYLPAIFSEEKESRWFLERFLSIFQTEWDQLEEKIADLPALFDPDAVPSGPFLRQLAQWIALPLEETWESEQQRNLLRQVRNFYPQRGTAAGLRIFLQAYLQNITGLSPEQQGDFPVLVEGYRRRNHTLLAAAGAEGLGSTANNLWSPSVVNRLQSDSHARAGEVRLVSTNGPPRDLFHTYAHSFQVYLPASWVRCANDERMVHRALEAEKPAHTGYELCLVPARFRVGVQSTVGLDTVVGGIPTTRLICPDELSERAPSSPLSPRLGYDTVLAGRAKTVGKIPFNTARL